MSLLPRLFINKHEKILMVILSIKVTFILSQGKIINLKKKFFITRYRERIYHVKVLGGSSKIARYIEILVI